MKKISELADDFSMSGLRRMQAPGNFRSGQQVIGSQHSIETDMNPLPTDGIQQEEMLPKFVLTYVTKGDKVLAASRGNDMTNFNMSGGSVEDGEEPLDACIRELWEETGLRANELFPIYSVAHKGKLVTTYKVTSCIGDLKSSWEGVPDWVDPQFLMSSQFGDYFKSMLDSL